MKYICKLWNKETYAFSQLEEQLNSMAQKGYQPINIGEDLLPIVIYRKSEGAKETRYAVEPVKKQDEEFIQLCEESGWNKWKSLQVELCVFTTTDSNTTPIFTDPMTKYANAREIINSSMERGCTIFALIALGLFMLLPTWLVGQLEFTPLKLVVALGWIYFAITIGTMIANNVYMKSLEEKTDAELLENKPRWMERWNRWVFYLSLIIILGVWVYSQYYIFIVCHSLFAGLVGFTMPLFFAAGFCLKNMFHREKLGLILMTVAVWLLLGGARVLSSWLG